MITQARAIAAKVHMDKHVALKGVMLPNQSCSHAEMAQLIEAGEMDDCIAVQSALAALEGTL